jgi:hypothetical protein
MRSNIGSRLQAVAAACALFTGCLPFGGTGARARSAPMAKNTSSIVGTGEITGIVMDSSSGQPIRNVVLFATTDTAQGAPLTPWRAETDSAGHFALTDVPAGWRVLEARAVGYARERRTVIVRRGRTDTLWVWMRSGETLLRQQREELSVPTSVTPCRPADVSSAWLANALAEAIAATPSSGDAVIARVKAEQIRLITKPGMCRRAIAIWEQRNGKALQSPQVYLFELGDGGFAIYDPVESLGNNMAVVPVFDRNWVITRVLTM